MKHIINNYRSLFFLSALVLLGACSGGTKKQKEPASKEELLQTVSTVAAVGKVVPRGGWTLLASAKSGTVVDIAVAEGDRVEKGQVLLRLAASEVPFDVDMAEAQLQRLQVQHKNAVSALKQAEVKLAFLWQQYITSKELYSKKAETKEKVDADYLAWQEQEQARLSLQQQIHAERAVEEEQGISVRKAQQEREDLLVRAANKGIVVELLAKVGQVVASSSELARIADTDSLEIDAEVDELFVDRVKVGQEVSLYSIGSKTLLGKGHITYVGPTLVNKSMLYETANEADDRRVRRITITPDQVGNLLINAKIDCQINVN